MMRKYTLAIAFFLLLGAALLAQESGRVKVAEGRYGLTGEFRDGKITSQDAAEWTLWQRSDGGYQMETTAIPPPHKPVPPSFVPPRSVLTYNRDFHLVHYELHVSNPEEKKQLDIECTFDSAELGCTEVGSNSEERHAYSGRSVVPEPYVFLPEILAYTGAMDLFLIHAQLAVKAAREVDRETKIGLVDFKDTKEGEPLAFQIYEHICAKYEGTETISVAGLQVTAHRYAMSKEIVWLSGIGLLLRLKDSDTALWELTRYKEFRPFLSESR